MTVRRPESVHRQIYFVMYYIYSRSKKKNGDVFVPFRLKQRPLHLYFTFAVPFCSRASVIICWACFADVS